MARKTEGIACTALFLLPLIIAGAAAGDGGGTCVAGDCENGVGTYVDEGGDRYEGAWQDGLPHGQGTYRYSDGSVYVGELKEGHFHGHGEATIAGAGQGAPSTSYVGEWKDNLQDGKGLMTWHDGGGTYDGMWKAGKQHGHGIRRFADGTGFEGQFFDGKRNGKGMVTYADGSKSDEGHYVRGRGPLLTPPGGCADRRLQLRMGASELKSANGARMADVSIVHRIQPYPGSKQSYLVAEPHPCTDPRGHVRVDSRLIHGGGWDFEPLIEHLLSTAAAARGAALVLDVGANIGAYTLFPASLGAHVSVVSVEVQPRLVARLMMSVAANGFGARVRVHNAAAGSPRQHWRGAGYLACAKAPAGDLMDVGACVDVDVPQEQREDKDEDGTWSKGVLDTAIVGDQGFLVPYVTIDNLVPEGAHVHFFKPVKISPQHCCLLKTSRLSCIAHSCCASFYAQLVLFCNFRTEWTATVANRTRTKAWRSCSPSAASTTCSSSCVARPATAPGCAI